MKKNYQLLTFIFVICFASIGNAQNADCGTEINLTESQKQEVIKTMQTDFVEFRNNLSEQPTPPIVVPIQIHIVSTTSGSGGVSEAVVLNEIANQVNPKYASIDMTFVPIGPTNYINSDTYYNISGKPEGQLMSVANSIPNVLNIYFVNDPNGACGWARFSSSLPEDYIVIANSCANNTSTLAHEIGHYFDLYHTHETFFGNELVNGSNCAVAGDLLCDTTADPRLTSLVSAYPGCSYFGSGTDSNGSAYVPDPLQVMSYSQKQCRVNFSTEAYNKILFTVQNARCYLFNSLTVVEDVCLSNGIQTNLSGGTPFGGVYSGLGVTDNNDGETYTLDPSIAGVGNLTITYTVNGTCGTTVILTDDLTITNTPPIIVCNGFGTLSFSGEETISPGAVISDGVPVTSIISVSDNQIITDLNIDLNIPHSWVGDILINLESPDGTVITIFDVVGGCSGDNLITTLDDEANTTSSACYGTSTAEAYPDQSYQPFASLSTFDGKSTAGDWTLTVTDTAGGDDGSLISWKLIYEYEIVNPPVTVALDASGLATINAVDLIYSVTTDCGGSTVLAGNVPAATISFTCDDVGSNTVNVIVTNDAGTSTMCTATVIVEDSVSCNTIVLSPKIYLQGAALNPNIGEETLMRDDLRIANLLPTTSPYSDALTCDNSVFSTTGSNAVVDWVYIELRSAVTNTTIVDSQSALLLRNGMIVAVDGSSNIEFNQPNGDYFVAIKHRNHLGIMSVTTLSLSSTITIIDFTDANNQITYGTNAQTTMGMPTNIVALWSGDVNADKKVQYIGASPDSPSILSHVLNEPGNFLNLPTFIFNGYNNNDVNMNGETQYTGTAPDTPLILQNVLSYSGNFLNLSTYPIEEQLPEN